VLNGIKGIPQCNVILTHLEKMNNNNVSPKVSSLIADLKKNGTGTLNKYKKEEIAKAVEVAAAAYYNNMPIMSDNEYDILENYATLTYGTICAIGAPALKNKVALPYDMPSLNKIKPDTGALGTWTSTFAGPYVISCKLDGVSGLYSTEGPTPTLYTRGDGKVGQDISHLLPFLKLPLIKNATVRGELIIPKHAFDTKYKAEFANPRNLVAGLINHKNMDPALIQKMEDIHFVAYEVLKPALKPSAQFEFLCCANMPTCFIATTPTLTNAQLSQWLMQYRRTYQYEIDGIIVGNDKVYKREPGNPAHTVAFKMVLSEQCAEAKVVDVIWSPSKDGYLKPRVQIEPLTLGGVKIEFATGFNAAFIMQNKIGVGALIQLVRSGDVIPHIKEVIVGATEAKMPGPEHVYEWNDTGIDIVLINAGDNETVLEKNITLFFKGIEVDGLSGGTVSKLVKAGYNSVSKIVNMKKEEMGKIDGLGAKSAGKICENIRARMAAVSIVTLMSASNLFGRGFGQKKLEPIMEMWPNILTENVSISKEEKVAKVMQVKGVAHKSAELFVDNIGAFNDFMSQLKVVAPVQAQATSVDETHVLYKKTVVLTGFRDKKLAEQLKRVGAVQGATVNKNTFALIMKDTVEKETLGVGPTLGQDYGVGPGLWVGTGSEKAQTARKLNVPIYGVDEFIKAYLSG
jgi:DNA ligase (NAD+)